MCEVNQSDLLTTVNRIKASLNKRYEKDAELYISYQDTLRIKHHIFAREYEAIENLIQAQIVSPTVVARVVVKNLWLLENLSKEDLKKLNVILNRCDTATLCSVMERIDENSIEINLELKESISKIYYGKVPVSVCLDYLNKSEKVHPDILKVCFIRVINSTEDVPQKMVLIKRFLSAHTSLCDSKYILSEIIKPLSDEEKSAFGILLEREILSSFMAGKEPPKLIENALLSYPDKLARTEKIIRYIYINSYVSYVPKPRAQVGCTFIRDCLKSLPSDEYDKGIDFILQIYFEIPENMQEIFEKKVLSYPSYKDNFKKMLDARLQEEEIEIVGSDSIAINSADDMYRFINVDKTYNSPKWYGYVVSACFFPPKNRKGELLIDFLKKYADTGSEYCAQHYPKLFATLGKRIYSSDNAISELVTFLHELKDGQYDNDSSWQVEEKKDLICLTLDEFVSAIVNRGIKPGGLHGPLYNYLYDYRREDCELLFDV